MRKPKDFALLRVVVITGVVLLGWAAVQIWVFDAPLYALAWAVGVLIGCFVTYIFFGWLRRKKSESSR